MFGSYRRSKPANPAQVTSGPDVQALVREDRITRIDDCAHRAWLRGDVEAMDRWLDMRLSIRPPHARAAVPVNPGRPS